MKSNEINSTKRLVGVSLFTALVVILQLLGSFIRFGPFSISLVAMPIVVGSAVYGVSAGTWLGLVFGAAVILSGDAASFMVVNVAGTFITVLAKGILCGRAAGLTYKLLEEKNSTAAAIAASIICPVINTGIFLIGCYLFFLPTVTEWGTAMGFENVGRYMIFGLVGGNFLVELGINVLLCPDIIRLIKYGKSTMLNKRTSA